MTQLLVMELHVYLRLSPQRSRGVTRYVTWLHVLTLPEVITDEPTLLTVKVLQANLMVRKPQGLVLHDAK